MWDWEWWRDFFDLFCKKDFVATGSYSGHCTRRTFWSSEEWCEQFLSTRWDSECCILVSQSSKQYAYSRYVLDCGETSKWWYVESDSEWWELGNAIHVDERRHLGISCHNHLDRSSRMCFFSLSLLFYWFVTQIYSLFLSSLLFVSIKHIQYNIYIIFTLTHIEHTQ
jgi:hypothetical protein